MFRLKHPRLIVAAALVAVWGASVTVTTQRSTSSRSAAAMTAAANKWLEALTPEQRQQASFALDAEEKVRWNFIPTNMFPRKGVPWKEMTEPQRKLAHELLKASLSQKGYVTATSIMELETLLHQSRTRTAKRARMCATPSSTSSRFSAGRCSKSTWGLRVEGHHVSLRFTVGNNWRSRTRRSSSALIRPKFVSMDRSKGLRIPGPGWRMRRAR